MKTTLRPINSS